MCSSSHFFGNSPPQLLSSRTLLRKDCFFGGLSVILQDTKARINEAMPLYILVVLPAALMLTDGIIRRTTLHRLVPESATTPEKE